MFKRRFNIMQMLLNDAPALVPELVDGLTWRPCIAANRNRHTNYFIKHLVIDLEAMFGDSWLYWKGQGPRKSLPSKLGPGDGHCVEPLFVQYAFLRGAH